MAPETAAADAPGPETAAADATPATAAEQGSAETGEWKGVKLHVKNLDDNVTKEALKALFGTHGTVKYAGVNVDKDGKSKGFGKVVMSTREEAEKAMAALTETMQGEKTMNVVVAPVTEKIKEYRKGDKGRGKGKDDKGKGKGNAGKAAMQQQIAYPPSVSPELDGWMSQNVQLDPVSSQLMQQQMLTWQLYAHQQQMAWQMEPDGTPYQPQSWNEKGKGKGKSKGGKDRGAKGVEGTYTGMLKSINFRNDKGYGFIVCNKLQASHGREVYVGSDLVPQDVKAGDQLSFNVTLDQRGWLRASNVKPFFKSKREY